MIGVITRLTVKTGANAAFEAAMKPIIAKVRSDESSNKLCALYKLPDANGYVLFQRYDNEKAFEAHQATPHYQELRRMLVDHLASRPDWQVSHEVA